ncbi:N-formylglutamate amidohydrolase [Stakelama marina]|uniref:N-formylglutamate amidohydrolase n=1 Tax=Stakelama marina TaxID=2826939 RepID=UPI0024C27C16|nr:N-formylglutamate amidohydrolase [Stakelama marina]
MTLAITPSFEVHGPLNPVSPVLLSVPHAGREYPDAMREALALPVSGLIQLEDRHVDAVAMAARRFETTIVARRARAWIDLNRAEDARDPLIDRGAPSRGHDEPLSLKLRSGLGLVPRRAGARGDIWRRMLSDAEIRQRIEADHRPYHQAVGQALAAARERFGVAVLLDIHSMPPLGSAQDTPRIVLGDRFGKSAGARLVSRADAVANAWGFRTALNSPYAGGYVLDRHGAPKDHIHAIQIEFDRSLYLDDRLLVPGPGLGRAAAMLRALIDALCEEAVPAPLAAE